MERNYVQKKREKAPVVLGKKKPTRQPAAPYTEDQRNGVFNFDTIHGLKLTPIEVCVPPLAERQERRNEFNGDYKKGVEGYRAKFIKYLAEHCEKELVEKLGLTQTDINRMKRGMGPHGYHVHHKVPLQAGGKNEFSNFILIPVYPHKQLHSDVMTPQLNNLKEGVKATVMLPYTDDMIYNPQEYGYKKDNHYVQPNPPTRCNPKGEMRNYRPSHISVEKRQQYMQAQYDKDREKAISYAEKNTLQQSVIRKKLQNSH